MIAPETLGSAAFRADYGLTQAYMAGAMVKGISSAAMVIRMARAGRLAVYGTGGQPEEEIDARLTEIAAAVPEGAAWGVNMLSAHGDVEHETAFVARLLRHGVRIVEASAFMEVTDALVEFRLSDLDADAQGRPIARSRIIAKISRPEVAAAFLAPPDPAVVDRLLQAGRITPEAAALAPQLPVASDVTVEADSGGHTDMGVTSTLLPAIAGLRDRLQAQHRFAQPVRVGSAGGIGTPEAAACAFLLGADYIVTGSINQCTVEASTSDAVKDVLAKLGVQDTAYAPAGDMFEMGAKVQVLRKGVFFPARASRLYDLWRNHGALDELPSEVRADIQTKYLGRSFDDVFEETRAHYLRADPSVAARAERDPKLRMALIFRWYFVRSMRLALTGDTAHRVDWQVYCGPALGAFNQWAAGGPFDNWRTRHVDDLADALMEGAARYLERRLGVLSGLDRTKEAAE
ncbi:PfaD family polyunsaturated fatty acid/polyketide biosynthesis protein [Jannaschia sp.]|nr:PfaD family polyunsaturated fatty acid/polyketide biosynthesis protein [Jannaschia sp.]